ncbi:MAG TPA: UDP-glucose/GDP-mannose dehydrogenase family protein [Geobacterales bacterium]|nr:UDP-glucose/GDP-mannose dehydrogenase family protein [Geobacterales bacterium]
MEYNSPTISFFGLGYVGIVTAACFASKGFKVLAYDVDKKKVELLNEGKSHIFEPGLDKLIKESVDKGKLKGVYDPFEAVLNSDMTFITVGTPSKQDGSIDLKFVDSASKMIGEALKLKDKWHLTVVKSTVIPGTTNKVVRRNIEILSRKKYDEEFGVCSNPEFLREGSAVEDTFNPDRLVIGGDEKSVNFLKRFYEMFYNPLPPTIITTAENSELIKYANNAFLAMKVSFINMISRICQKLPNGDIEVIAKGIGLDKRIGPLFLRAGAGWGGSCWPKDLNALKKFAEELELKLPLVDATIEVNNTQPLIMIDLAKEELKDLKGKTISVLGLSFKPNTDDVRDAVSIKIINNLLEEGAIVKVYDPKAMENIYRIFQDKLTYAGSAIECIKNSDCAMLVTEWDEFKRMTPEDYLKNMRNPFLIDGRRIYDPKLFSGKMKFKAIGLGNRV